MSTASAVAAPPALHHQTARAWRRGATLAGILTPYAFLVQGYHPFAEDGGLYLAGVEYLLDPTLFLHQRGFVTAHLRFSAFAPVVAGITRLTHLPLGLVVLACHLLCLWLTLLASWALAAECFSDNAKRAGATLLVAAWLGLPVAGTSLVLADPYLTARSFSTPAVLFALGCGLRARSRNGHRWNAAEILCATGWLSVAACFHPLMAGFGAVAVLLLLLTTSRPFGMSWRVCVLAQVACAVALGLLLQHTGSAETLSYQAAARSRSYWYLSQWHWYELFGLVVPPLLLEAVSRRTASEPLYRLSRMATALALCATVVAVCFARPWLTPHVVARLQPLRSLSIVQLLLFLALGGRFAPDWSGQAWRYPCAAALLGLSVLPMQRSVYPTSPYIEWPPPSTHSANAWVRAFLWIRARTPKDAVFALDAEYISLPGEDAQAFRAIAERSALPDASKDGGEASITPALAPAWAAAEKAQEGLSSTSDSERLRRLAPFGATWMVLQRTATTSADCPYRNEAVAVCLLPRPSQTAAPTVREEGGSR